MVCGQTYSRKVDVDCLNVLASLGASVHKVSRISNLYISIALYFIYTHIISQFMCRNKEKVCFQNIRTNNKLLHFNVSHRFQLCSCFVDLYRYKIVS